MRILSVGDLHGDRSLAERLAKRAEQERVDLVLICGDLTFFDREPKGIIGPFLERKKKVLFVPGNHDSFVTADMLTHAYPIKNLHGYSVKYDDVGIFGCGKANVGIERLDEEEFFAALQKAHGHISYLKKSVMVTHVHPAAASAEKLSGYPGSAGVRKAIEKFQPDVAFCGHIHEAEGIEERIGRTRVINVGSKGFVLDL